MPRPKPSIEDEVRDLVKWSGQAACQNRNPRSFDTRRRNQHTALTKANERAIEVCLECPVMMLCLEHAITYSKTGAIYGGMTDEERDEWLARQEQVLGEAVAA